MLKGSATTPHGAGAPIAESEEREMTRRRLKYKPYGNCRWAASEDGRQCALESYGEIVLFWEEPCVITVYADAWSTAATKAHVRAACRELAEAWGVEFDMLYREVQSAAKRSQQSDFWGVTRYAPCGAQAVTVWSL